MASPIRLFNAPFEVNAPDSKSARYLTLDHWRGVACLLVVIYHATLPLCDSRRLEVESTRSIATRSSDATATKATHHRLFQLPRLLIGLTSQMHLGVEMFFVISGYCIAASAESMQRSNRPIRDYFRRRLIRIFPPFWCAVVVSLGLCCAFEYLVPGRLGSAPWPVTMPWDMNFIQWFGSLTLTGTWCGRLLGESAACYPIQAWSLCYEEQFYAVIGTLLLLGGRHLFRATAILTGLVLLVDLICLRTGLNIKGFFFDEHWLMFAAGVGVFWTVNRATRLQAHWYFALLVSAIFALFAASFTTSLFGHGSQFSAWRVISALGFALLLTTLKKADRQIANWVRLDWLKSCGVMCYSIYLIHLFPCKIISLELIRAGFRDDLSTLLLTIPLCLVTAISLGYIFHQLVERRFVLAVRGETMEISQPRLRLLVLNDEGNLVPSAWTEFSEQSQPDLASEPSSESEIEPIRRKVA